MKTLTVTLTTPLHGPRGEITEFRFREPKFNDLMELGDPRIPVLQGDIIVWQKLPNVVRDYAERLLVDGDPNILAGASLRDALEIERTIIGFFTDAEAPKTRPASPAN